MAWDNTPWFVGGGALHSPEVARTFAFAATSGAQGVVAPGDLAVVPLSPAGTSVRALPGAALILNRAAGGEQQTYTARLVSEDAVGVTATGTSAGRNDLVIARVEDPFMPGEAWQEPADPATGQYVYTRILANVPASAVASPKAARDYLAAQGFSAIPLAGLIIPANTATIDASMIRDLRNLARPRSSSVTFMTQPNAAAGSYDSLTTATFRAWPAAYTPSVDVPEWATHYDLLVHVSAIGAVGGTAQGDLRTVFGTSVSGSVGWDTANVTDGNRVNALVAAGGALGAMAGTTQTVRLEGRRTSGAGTYRLQTGTTVVFEVRFYEKAV